MNAVEKQTDLEGRSDSRGQCAGTNSHRQIGLTIALSFSVNKGTERDFAMSLRPSVGKKKFTAGKILFIVRFRTQKQHMLC